MSAGPSRQGNFWQELKRLKVFKVITMYAASAFIILEVVDIVAPSLGLPHWTLKLAIILLIIGFPVTALPSWIFDITPEGIKKTKALDALDEKESEQATRKRKLRAGDVIIVVLLLILRILAYPKIFGKERFEHIRDKDGRIAYSKSPEAFRYYSEGVHAMMRMEYNLASDLFKKALGIDSSFALAAHKAGNAISYKKSGDQDFEEMRIPGSPCLFKKGSR